MRLKSAYVYRCIAEHLAKRLDGEKMLAADVHRSAVALYLTDQLEDLLDDDVNVCLADLFDGPLPVKIEPSNGA